MTEEFSELWKEFDPYYKKVRSRIKHSTKTNGTIYVKDCSWVGGRITLEDFHHTQCVDDYPRVVFHIFEILSAYRIDIMDQHKVAKMVRQVSDSQKLRSLEGRLKAVEDALWDDKGLAGRVGYLELQNE